MTLKDMEVAASKGEPMPDGLTLPEQTYYLGLENLYRAYRRKDIALERAKKDKAALKQAFQNTNAEFEKYRVLMDARLDARRQAEAEKNEVLKGILLGGHPYTLMLRLAHCLGIVTGDAVFFDQCNKDVRLICDHVDSPEPEDELRALDALQKRLEAAAGLEDDAHAKARITAAINQNKKRIAYLKGE